MKNEVAILGGGQQGLAMAAYLSANQINCYLWNRTQKNIQKIIDSKKVCCLGVVQGEVSIYHASSHIEDCLKKLILVTTPSTAHRDIAKMLAPYVDSSYVIVLNPGRTFGILDFISTLQENGCTYSFSKARLFE